MRSMNITKKQTEDSALAGNKIICILMLIILPTATALQIKCKTDQDCAQQLKPLTGSQCQTDGTCSNPFHHGGCLAQHRNNNNKNQYWRVCHSDDPPEAADQGHCWDPQNTNNKNTYNHTQTISFNYKEIRIFQLGWESATFIAWVLQIVLSEILQVPVSLELGAAHLKADFYHPQAPLDYPTNDDVVGMANAYQEVDCTRVKQGDHYIPCTHLLPETWKEGDGTRKPLVDNGWAEYKALGALAEQYWYIPKFVAEQDPSLGTYMGLVGEQNRRKLAETFLTPTTWKDYCDIVSNNTCAEPDNVAQRYPQTNGEEESMFVNGLYTGHFRKTPEQDCDLNEDCWGHIADYPCEWSSYVPIQAHWLNISLKSTGKNDPVGGYSYKQLTEIWAAANATRSPVMMVWWNPEALFQTYLGTDAEFTHVVLPPPTQTCQRAVENYRGRCLMDDPTAQYLDEKLSEGTCDYAPQGLRKLISTVLKELAQDPSQPSELWSPAYDVIKNYEMTELYLGEIFKAWQTMQNEGSVTDRNLNLRRATCQWVVDNLDSVVSSWIPDTFPRTMVQQNFRTLDNEDQNGVYTAAFVVACIVALLICVTLVITFIKRNTRIVYFLRLEWLLFVQFGMLLITLGSWLIVMPQSGHHNDELDSTTSGQCVAAVWLTSTGYVWLLLPLLIRTNAIYRGKVSPRKSQMHRVRVSKQRLLWGVAAATLFVLSYVLIWNLIDPPTIQAHYEQTETLEGGITLITRSEYCGSDSNVWMTANIAWQILLVLSATIVSFMAANRYKDLNDSRLLSLLILAHLLFAILRFALVALRDSIADPIDGMAFFSLAMTCECLVSLAVFVIPKVVAEQSEIMDSEQEKLPELFMDCTIMYAHIDGFEGWSSVREASQVFEFLDDLYTAFDSIAEERGVFNLTPTSESYVAATGIPVSRADHALQMARYAFDISSLMRKKCQALEIVYGPDTGDLALQIGLSSGAVTGGFMNGGSRFQIIGDTASLAKQVAAAGKRGRILVTQETANHLIHLGKKEWLREREGLVNLKVSGESQLYWLGKSNQALSVDRSLAFSSEEEEVDFLSSSDGDLHEISLEISAVERKRRLVNWNVGVLHQLLKQIYARRRATAVRSFGRRASAATNIDVEANAGNMNGLTAQQQQHPQQQQKLHPQSVPAILGSFGNDTPPLEEVKEIIALPNFNRKIAKRQKSEYEEIEIPTIVLDQLHQLVSTIGDLYNDNPFHNFEHASHVVMSTLKHLNRIVAPTDLELESENDQYVKAKAAAALHDHTYGITSSPLTQFSCVFAALIHDVDHPGIPNIRLAKENPELAKRFKNRSVAEQKAFTIAWGTLMKPEFSELVAAICGDDKGLARFRQLVINSVMATDLGDRELRKLRNGRWDRAFKFSDANEEAQEDKVNRKATIVIEHLIQSADVSHTMQHWDVYREWNENLFAELYNAFRAGRSDVEPSTFWYEGEIGFFDHYVIPLSKKLSECGVFGVSSDENLSYATRNRDLWVSRGKLATAEMHEKCRLAWDSENPTTPQEGQTSSPVSPPLPLPEEEKDVNGSSNSPVVEQDEPGEQLPSDSGILNNSPSKLADDPAAESVLKETADESSSLSVVKQR